VFASHSPKVSWPPFSRVSSTIHESLLFAGASVASAAACHGVANGFDLINECSN